MNLGDLIEWLSNQNQNLTVLHGFDKWLGSYLLEYDVRCVND